MTEFLICEFAKETLSNLVKDRFGSEFPDINSKKQIKYLYRYLSDYEAKTILLEPDYVDKDFLEDYSRYYVKCFSQYGNRCARLHFFKKDLNHEEFSKYLESYKKKDKKELQDAYIGFIVVKPLPKTFIGKSCLNIYKSFYTNKNKKIVSHVYSVNLFGIELQVDTVAFQEQDKVVSACATTSIWTALQALDKSDLRNIPSLSEITLSAINHVTDSSNSFPNNGLTNKQILRSLDIQKMRNHKFNIDTSNHEEITSFFNIIKSYINSNLPLILGVDVYWLEEKLRTAVDGRGHAVTILGYKENSYGKFLYIHDDRVGPFARFKVSFDSVEISKYTQSKSQNTIAWGLVLEEKNDSGEWIDSEQILIPDSLIIPNYRKVRISSDYIENTCNSVIKEYEHYWKEHNESSPNINFNLELCSSAIYKSKLISMKAKNKRDILTRPLSKYIWVASFLSDNVPLFDIIFDSTEIPQGDAVSGIVIYNEDGYSAVRTPLINILEHNDNLHEISGKDFLVPLIRSLKPKGDDYFSYLDSKYGEPRAPKRINKQEISGNNLNSQDAMYFYGKEDKKIDDDFPEYIGQGKEKFLIWVISFDGALLIGKEENRNGHPTLTGFKPARIAGELWSDNGTWHINSKSGRYSSDYENSNALLHNAKNRFLEVYSLMGEEELVVEEFIQM